MRNSDAWKVINTWCNAWTTSWRMHEEIKYPCIFGCKHPAADNLIHYVRCPHLYAFGKFFLGQAPHCHVARLGLLPNASEINMHMCCVFSGYHASHRAIRNRPQQYHLDNLNFSSSQLRCLLGVLADAYFAEARNLLLKIRTFSSSEFLHSLTDTSDPIISTLHSSPNSELVAPLSVVTSSGDVRAPAPSSLSLSRSFCPR